MKQLDKIKSVIYGLAVGDALGVPAEFMNRDTYKITDMIGHGTYDQHPGTWSDDTSLTLILIRHLYENSDLHELMTKMNHYRSGYMTPYNECFDIGIATEQAIDRFMSGHEPETCGGTSESNNGNGALMRISPLAFTLKTLDKKFEEIAKYTKITHGHPRAIVASLIYIQILMNLLDGYDLKTALTNTKNDIVSYCDTNVEYRNEYNTYYQDIFEDEFLTTDRSEIESSGYVVHSLKASLWSLANSKNYQEAVLNAVNLGGDTDTIGAITGSLAGALYGFDNIPEKWINILATSELIDYQCNQLNEITDYN